MDDSLEFTVTIGTEERLCEVRGCENRAEAAVSLWSSENELEDKIHLCVPCAQKFNTAIFKCGKGYLDRFFSNLERNKWRTQPDGTY